MKKSFQADRQSIWIRFVFPAGLMLLIWLTLRVVYTYFWQLGYPALQDAVAWICSLGERFFVVLAPLLTYPLAYFRGARGWERLAAGFVPFLAWWVFVLYKAAGVFSPGETAYYAFGSPCLVYAFTVLAMSGVAELMCRLLARRRDTRIEVWTPLPLSAILSGITALFLMMIWGGGVHWFYFYQEGYKALFH